MATQAHNAANVRYNKRMDAIMLRPDKDTGARIRAAAAAAGQSLQRYIVQACRERMEREVRPATPEQSVDGPAPEA